MCNEHRHDRSFHPLVLTELSDVHTNDACMSDTASASLGSRRTRDSEMGRAAKASYRRWL